MVVKNTKKNNKTNRIKTRKNYLKFKNRTKKNRRQKLTRKHQFGGDQNYMDIIKEYKNLTDNLKKKERKYYYDLSKGRKIYAFADVHGDFRLLVKLLKMSGVMSSNDLPKPNENGIYDINEMQKYFNSLKWTGGNSYVVQIGDQIDRTRDVISHKSFQDEGSTFEIVYLLKRLNELAIEYNKDKQKNQPVSSNYVFSMLGNHEMMNVDGDLRYCSLAEFKVFAERLNSNKLTQKSQSNKNKTNMSQIYKYGDNENDEESLSIHRRNAYKPGGIMANYMSQNHNTLIQIGPFLFVHGGLPLNIAKEYSIFKINEVVSRYLRGDKLNEDKKALNEITKNLLWNRDMSQDSHKETIESIRMSRNEEIPLKTKLRRIMRNYQETNNKSKSPQILCVGHTPQYFVKEDANLLFSIPTNNSTNNPNNKTSNKKTYELYGGNNFDVLRLDTGSSRAFGEVKDTHRRPQIAVLSTSVNNNGETKINIEIIS